MLQSDYATASEMINRTVHGASVLVHCGA